MKQAPIFTQTYSFSSWLLDHLEKMKSYTILKETLGNTCLEFLESITLALKGCEKQTHIRNADNRLAYLKILLRLAEEKEMLTTNQYHFSLECLDDIGRQLGAWKKATT